MTARIVLTGLALTVAAGAWAQGEIPNYAERLGWPEGSKVVIFHIDDAGMCHDANVGCFEALADGLATSVSIMMPCGWVPEFIDWCKEHPDVDAGVHLTLTSEWDNYRWGPLAGCEEVPGLCDAAWCFYGDVPDVVKNATPDEVEIEIRAQVERAREMGWEPTHLDSHMGTLFQPTFFQRYVKVGMELGIPVLVPGGHMQFIGQNNPLAGQVRAVAQQVWDAGLPVVDDIQPDTYDWKSFEDKKKNLIELLETMKPGITEVILHCTKPSDVFASISTSGETRYSDLKVMLDPDVRRVIQEQGIILTTWRELKQRRDRVGGSK